jgi:hypothetical protein
MYDFFEGSVSEGFDLSLNCLGALKVRRTQARDFKPGIQEGFIPPPLASREWGLGWPAPPLKLLAKAVRPDSIS